MKKVLLAVLLTFAGSARVMAQGQMGPAGTMYPVDQSYYSRAVGTPGLQLNSNSATVFGQLGNVAGSTAWYLGYGTSLTANGTAALTWDNTPAITANAPLVLSKSQVGTAATSTAGVTQSTIVPVGSSYISVLSSAPTTVVLTSLPNISTTTTVGGTTEIADGTWIVIRCTSTVSGVVFQDNGTLSGSQLELGAASRTVTQFKTLTLVYDAVVHKWLEVAFGNN